MTRERLLATTFVDLTGSLIGGDDVETFLQMLVERCVELIEAEAVGVMLTDRDGTLRLASASTSDMHALELFEIQSEQGPCFEAYARGEQNFATDLTCEREQRRWPRFTPRARELGFQSVHAFPLRFQDRTIGALNVFYRSAGKFDETDSHTLQALADVATLAVVQHGDRRRSSTLTDQLQRALDSRVLLEQAKGVLSADREIGMEAAFAAIRDAARHNRQRLRDVAEHVVEHRELPMGSDRRD